MKKNTKKILALSVLGFFMFVFALTVVSAQTNNPIADWFANWEDGENFSANIAKYLFWVLITLVIYAISDAIPFLKDAHGGIKFGVSAIVGFLSMAYITPDEIYVLMTTYSALGFAIGIMIPFIIVMAFTIKLAAQKDNENRLFNKFFTIGIWVVFSGFMIYKLVTLGGDIGSDAPTWIKTFIWLLSGISIIMIFAVGTIFNKIRKYATKEELNILEEKTKKSAAAVNARVKEVEDIAGGPAITD